MAGPVILKVVLVGAEGSGKSNIILSLTNNTFKTVHTPTTFDNYVATIKEGQLDSIQWIPTEVDLTC